MHTLLQRTILTSVATIKSSHCTAITSKTSASGELLHNTNTRLGSCTSTGATIHNQAYNPPTPLPCWAAVWECLVEAPVRGEPGVLALVPGPRRPAGHLRASLEAVMMARGCFLTLCISGALPVERKHSSLCRVALSSMCNN